MCIDFPVRVNDIDLMSRLRDVALENSSYFKLVNDFLYFQTILTARKIVIFINKIFTQYWQLKYVFRNPVGLSVHV